MTDAEVKEITQEFVLITYDMPAKLKAERHVFLRDAHALGAIEHSQSCYYLPYTPASFALANTLADTPGATVYVWRSHQPDQKKAAELMSNYEQKVKIRCDVIEQRLAIAQSYVDDGKLGMAQASFKVTMRLLSQLAKINESFKPDWLAPRILELATKLKGIYQGEEKS